MQVGFLQDIKKKRYIANKVVQRLAYLKQFPFQQLF